MSMTWGQVRVITSSKYIKNQLKFDNFEKGHITCFGRLCVWLATTVRTICTMTHADLEQTDLEHVKSGQVNFIT